MDANVTAPTITIDGVTSKPGEPITMVALDCGNHMIVDTHEIEESDPLLCDAGPHEDTDALYCWVTGVLKTWKF